MSPDGGGINQNKFPLCYPLLIKLIDLFYNQKKIMLRYLINLVRSKSFHYLQNDIKLCRIDNNLRCTSRYFRTTAIHNVFIDF